MIVLTKTSKRVWLHKMGTNNLLVDMQDTPLEIGSIFFSRSDIEFSIPLEERANDFIKQNASSLCYDIATHILVPDDDPYKIQVGVDIVSKSADALPPLTSIKITCIGLYKWLLDSPPSTIELQQIYAWAIAVQMGACRQHIIEKTAAGPFNAVAHLPIRLVRVRDKDQAKPSQNN